MLAEPGWNSAQRGVLANVVVGRQHWVRKATQLRAQFWNPLASVPAMSAQQRRVEVDALLAKMERAHPDAWAAPPTRTTEEFNRQSRTIDEAAAAVDD